jgi:SSS family solute:Na+ symporter
MPIKLNSSDLVVIVLYLVSIAGIICWHSKRNQQVADFLLAGRKLTLPVFVGTLVATWYGGVLGIAEFTAGAGLAAWFTQGIMWYGVYLLFAFFFVSRISSLPFYTVVDVLDARFGRAPALLGGLFTYLMVNPAPYLLSLGVVLHLFVALSLPYTVCLGAVCLAIYTMLGGFRGVAYSDLWQCVWMYLAFGLLFVFALYQWGGASFLQQNLTRVPGYEHHLALHGGLPWPYLLAWGGMACWVLVDPNFYQRCYAATSPQVARRGVIIAILCWAVFDILSCGSALYAVAAHNAHILSIADTKMAHFVAADYLLPSPLKGLFIAGVVANIASTADSFLLAGASILARDFYWRLCRDKTSTVKVVTATRWGIVFTALFAAALAVWCPSVVRLWYTIGTIGVSALLVPMLCALFVPCYCRNKAALASLLSGGMLSLLWLLLGHTVNGSVLYPLGLEPLYPGLLASLVAYLVVFWFL